MHGSVCRLDSDMIIIPPYTGLILLAVCVIAHTWCSLCANDVVTNVGELCSTIAQSVVC